MPQNIKQIQPSVKCYALIKSFEGFFKNAYLCPADVPTIGYGTIIYPNGNKVKLGEACTESQANEWLAWEVNQKAAAVRGLLYNVIVTQSMFDALVSFAYNLGIGALEKSTLLKKIRINPNDASIRAEFAKWIYAGGKILNGLVRRRKAEADLYFS